MAQQVINGSRLTCVKAQHGAVGSMPRISPFAAGINNMEFDMPKPVLAALTALLVLSGPCIAAPAYAADCTGQVVGVRSPSAYNRATGSGFLAVRTGPGSDYRQIGELYAGDEVAAYDRRGSWYAVACMRGQCMRPFWGQPMPRGWVHGHYLRLGGVCP